MATEYRYDAFISYRHQAPSKPIAERLQKLLETYVPPKELRGEGKKLRLFRDETELPTSSDLGRDIEDALEHSRFLVVICSPEYEQSKWCMQEVAYFKKLHGGSTRQILTLLVGDPDTPPVFPEALRFEPRRETLPDGSVRETLEEIEPLAANVSAETLPKAQKKLKTEFLRIAAPLLGCRFDDLYNREQRRQSQRKTRIALISAAVLAAATLLSSLALVTISGQKRQIEADAQTLRENNAELLVRESKLLEQSGDLYGALASALEAFPEEGSDEAAPNGAAAQAAALTGAFEPAFFPAVRQIRLGSQATDICLLSGGTRLAAITGSGTSLWDTETGECLKTYRGGGFYAALSRCREIGAVSVSYYAKGTYSAATVGGVPLLYMYRKDLREETQAYENALYLIDNETSQVQRISPEDGSVLWAREMRYCSFPSGELCSGEGVPVKDTSTLWVLNPDDGEILASLSDEEIERQTGASMYDAVYTQDHLLLSYSGEQSLQLAVFRREGEGFRFLYQKQISDLAGLGQISLLVRDGTVLVSGIVYDEMVNSTAVFQGYDLETGDQRWDCAQRITTFGDAYAGFVSADKGSANPFDVGFAVAGNRLFAVNAQTGTLLLDAPLPGDAYNLCYSENGFVFVTNEKGQEFFFALRRLKEADNEAPSMLLNRDSAAARLFDAEYCNNIYAIAQESGMAITLYRPAQNESLDTVFRLPEDGDSSLAGEMISPDGTLAAAWTYEPKEVHIIDLRTQKVLQTIALGEGTMVSCAFLGNDYLLAERYGCIRIYEISSGRLVQEFSGDDYSMSRTAIISDRAELILETDEQLMLIRPGQKPEQLLRFADAVENSDILHISAWQVSPSGGQVFVSLMDYAAEDDQMDKLFLYDRENEAWTQLMTDGDAPVPDLPDECVWTEDEETLYLLDEGVVHGFDCKTGERLLCASYDVEIADVIALGDTLCVLDAEGTFSRVHAEGGQLIAERSVTLTEPRPASGFLSRVRDGDGRLFLRQNVTGWLFDEQAFEVVYEIPGFRGMSGETGMIYTHYYDCFNAYPAYTPEQIAARARAIIQ